MPTNKKEGLFFTTMMCGLMVIGMSIYNLSLHQALTLENFAIGLIPAFIFAFILDVFIVGVVAKKIAFSLPISKEKPILLILTISTLMILGMVTFMSAFGVIMNGQVAQIGSIYAKTWLLNFVVALPYQLIIVGPLSRFALSQVQQTVKE